MNDTRTFILGLDGADWSVLEPLIAEGVLPNFARLYRGAHGFLNSTVPPLTPPGWTASVTGRNPGKHGIYDFFRPGSGDYDVHLTNREDRRCRAIWNYVSEEGGRVLVMNVPHTFPPEDVNGYLVSGFGTPEWDCAYTYPAELKGRILKRHPDFRVDMPSRLLHEGKFKEFCEMVDSHCAEQFAVFKELYAELKPHFAMFAFVEMDRLFHFFWKENMVEKTGPYKDLFRRHFVFLDGLLGDFLASLPSDCYVAVISDHGFGAVDYDIYVNNWLRDHGYLSLLQGADEVKAGEVPKWKLMVASLLDRVGLWQLYLKKRRAMLEKQAMAGAGAETVRSATALKAVDWKGTRAYFSSMSARCVRINLAGREVLGTVSPENYGALQDEIIRGLMNIRDKEGRPVITRAWKAKDVFCGDYCCLAADIYLEPREGYSFNQGFGRDLIMPSTQHGQARSGDHRQYGVCMLQGPMVKQGVLVAPCLYDITPTMLYLMGIPLSKDFDGEPMTEALDDEFVAAHPIRRYTEAPYMKADIGAAEDSEKLRQRLKDLGYL